MASEAISDLVISGVACPKTSHPVPSVVCLHTQLVYTSCTNRGANGSSVSCHTDQLNITKYCFLHIIYISLPFLRFGEISLHYHILCVDAIPTLEPTDSMIYIVSHAHTHIGVKTAFPYLALLEPLRHYRGPLHQEWQLHMSHLCYCTLL